MKPCIFCQIARGEAPSWKIFEDEDTIAFFDIHPASPYHTLVIPRQHYENIFDVPENDLLAVMATVRRLAHLYQEKLGIRNLQILNSSGAEAQQDVFHLHFHIVPRRRGDGQNIAWSTHPSLVADFDRFLKALK